MRLKEWFLFSVVGMVIWVLIILGLFKFEAEHFQMQLYVGLIVMPFTTFLLGLSDHFKRKE